MENNPVPIINVLVNTKAVSSYSIIIRVRCYLLSLSYANPKEGHENGERRQEKEPRTHNAHHSRHTKDPCPPHSQSSLILAELPPHSPTGPEFPESRESKTLTWGNDWALSLPQLSSPFLSPTPVPQHHKKYINVPPLLYQQCLLPWECREGSPEAMSPPPTGNPKWKRSHHQPPFLLERLSSRYMGGRDSDSLGMQPSPARRIQGLHPPAGAPDSGGSWTSKLISICPRGSKWPWIHGHFTD